MIRRVFITAFLMTLLVGGTGLVAAPTPAMANGHAERARTFIEHLAGDALSSLTATDIPRTTRIERFRSLFNDHFAVAAIGRWVLGRHWKRASESEQAEYLQLFEDLIVATYVDRFSSYAGEKLAVSKAIEQDAQAVMVYSDIIQPAVDLAAQTTISVNWRVNDAGNNTFKITDVIVEGVSMSQTMRSDFSSTIRAQGGTVGGLLAVLREKTATIKAEAAQ